MVFLAQLIIKIKVNDNYVTGKTFGFSCYCPSTPYTSKGIHWDFFLCKSMLFVINVANHILSYMYVAVFNKKQYTENRILEIH